MTMPTPQKFKRRRHRQLQAQKDQEETPVPSSSLHASPNLLVVDEKGNPLDFTIPSKRRTLLLLRLNLASYPTCQEKIDHGSSCSYSANTMKDIFSRRLSIFGSNITNIEQENEANIVLDENNWNLLTEINNLNPPIDRSFPQDHAKYEFGVSAQQWTIPHSNTTILVFRGTYSSGDYANIENWMLDFVLEKSTTRMKQAWTTDAGLEWPAEFDKRTSRSNRYNQIELRTFETNKPSKLSKELVDTIEKNITLQKLLKDDADDEDDSILTIEEAKASGYWKLTKYIVDQVAADAKRKKQSLILTGHSQGGTRAQLASMYLRQKTGVEYPTITFAATGSACMSRLLYDTNANLLDDVNPFIAHAQMTDYAHPLDPWGNSMLGEDNGGQVCFWGTTALRKAASENAIDGAYTYCSQVYGMDGATLIMKGSIGGQDAVNFQSCRYYTHMVEAMLFGLETNLLKDGTSDGGCHTIKPIPQNDPDGRCPIGRMSLAEDEAVGVMLSIIILLVGCLCFFCWCCCYRRQQQGACCRPALKHEPLQIDDHNDDAWLCSEEAEEFHDEEEHSQFSIELPIRAN